VRIDNVRLGEDEDAYFDFDNIAHHRRGRRDQDRFIDRVIVYGTAGNIFGSKAELQVFGGR
ncbi:MAG: hypothetical protein HUU37_07885, partial [Bdellovibrionales bacterium]|nr:hypothetical protein [Bdellovibrionales bacterium]